MTSPLEHDYIGLSEVSSMENSDKISSSSSTLSSEEETKTKTKTHTKTNSNNTTSLNLKETELRLGLPGSMSPQRGVGAGLSLQIKGVEEKNGYQLGVLKNFVSGAKRGFSDAIDANGKWGFSGNGGSEADLGKGGVLFSPRGGNGGNDNSAPAVKEVVPPSPKPVKEKKPQISSSNDHSPPAKAQVVGWPPVRAFRKNMAANSAKNNDDAEGKSGSGCLYVKVSMDGAPYLRKVDLKIYSNYTELSSALEKMFSCFTIGHCSSHGAPGRDGLSESHLMDLLHGSEYVLTYEDKDSDWMLVGDVPWDMFTDSCKRLRIMKGSEAIGFAQCKIRN